MRKSSQPTAQSREWMRKSKALHKRLRAEVRSDRKAEREKRLAEKARAA